MPLDVGRYSLRGWITDRRGNAVAMATANVRMAHTENGIRNVSAREAISDADGYLELSGLGPGIHTVRGSALGFAAFEFDTDVGADHTELTIEVAGE